MLWYQWFIGQFLPAISRTLLHSLWQGMIAALLAGVIILCTRKTLAALRYNALLLLYGLLVVAVAVTFYVELQSSTFILSGPSTYCPMPGETVIIDPTTLSFKTSEPGFINEVLAFVDKYANLFVSAWFFFVIFQLTRMVFGLREINKIKQKQTSVPAAEWTNWIEEKSRQLGISQPVVLLQSAIAKVPVAIGYFKPVVLVPLGLLTNLSAAQAETILLHELAHIKRKDYVVNLLQCVIDAIFFFNPAFVWLSFLIRQEREKCCDDMVIHHTENQHNYLEALVSFQEMNLSSGLAMAIGNKRYYLLSRVRRILTNENSRLSMREATALVVGIIIFGIALMAFKPISPNQALPVPKSSSTLFGNADIINDFRPIVSSVSAIKDTVPQKARKTTERPLKFKKIISNIVDDGGNNTYQIQATEENGTVYKIRKQGDDVTSFSVNGKEIAKSEYHKYNIIMAAIEDAKRKQLSHALNGRHLEHRGFEPVFDTLNLKFDLNLNSELFFNDSLFHQEHLLKFDENHEVLFNLELDNSLSQNPTIASIINDLIWNKLIQEGNNVSFSLNNSELVVNGKVQSKAMHEKFKSKYLKHPSDRYKYSRQGTSTSTEIHKN